MTPLTDIAIIGPGKVGTTLGVLAARAGAGALAVGARRPDQARAAAERIGCGARPCTPAEAAASARLVLLTVSDAAIEPLCNELAAANAFADGTSVVHCSGVLDSSVLVAAKERCGCSVASMHPLQTFATVDSAVAAFDGTFVFCEGDEPALCPEGSECIPDSLDTESDPLNGRGEAGAVNGRGEAGTMSKGDVSAVRATRAIEPWFFRQHLLSTGSG